jgi:hypothetical protein
MFAVECEIASLHRFSFFVHIKLKLAHAVLRSFFSFCAPTETFVSY